MTIINKFEVLAELATTNGGDTAAGADLVDAMLAMPLGEVLAGFERMGSDPTFKPVLDRLRTALDGRPGFAELTQLACRNASLDGREALGQEWHTYHQGEMARLNKSLSAKIGEWEFYANRLRALLYHPHNPNAGDPRRGH